MKTLLLTVLVMLLAACGQPTRQELLEAEAARQAECRKMLKEVEDAADRPLIRASCNSSEMCHN